MRRDAGAVEPARTGETLAEDLEWLFLDGHSADFFRMGDQLRAGRIVGHSASGQTMLAARDGVVVGVEYDWDSDQLILVVAPSTRGARRPRASFSSATGRADLYPASSGDRLPQAGRLE